jgi:hypothetical protein
MNVKTPSQYQAEILELQEQIKQLKSNYHFFKIDNFAELDGAEFYETKIIKHLLKKTTTAQELACRLNKPLSHIYKLLNYIDKKDGFCVRVHKDVSVDPKKTKVTHYGIGLLHYETPLINPQY